MYNSCSDIPLTIFSIHNAEKTYDKTLLECDLQFLERNSLSSPLDTASPRSVSTLSTCSATSEQSRFYLEFDPDTCSFKPRNKAAELRLPAWSYSSSKTNELAPLGNDYHGTEASSSIFTIHGSSVRKEVDVEKCEQIGRSRASVNISKPGRKKRTIQKKVLFSKRTAISRKSRKVDATVTNNATTMKKKRSRTVQAKSTPVCMI